MPCHAYQRPRIATGLPLSLIGVDSLKGKVLRSDPDEAMLRPSLWNGLRCE